MGEACTVVWFRRDLRLEDNPALSVAARVGAVVPLFVWAAEEEGQFRPGRASRWWLSKSLIQLDQSLRSLGAPLVLRRANDSLSALLDLVKSTGATQVFYNHLYDPISLVRDQHVKQGLLKQGIQVQSFNSDLLYEPWEIQDEDGQPFTAFEDYWKKCLAIPHDPEAPLLPPRRLIPVNGNVSSCSVEELGLEDNTEKSSNALLTRVWQPGWTNADKALDSFMAGSLHTYAKDRHKIDAPNTSLLSPHSHFGEISIRKLFHLVRRKQALWAKESSAEGEENAYQFLRSVGLREYSRYICFNFPFTHERSLLSNLKSFPWRADEGLFKAWRQGRTGYPLVDAGMRELWATGWLHNRVRVIVASFCVKFLQLPWRWGMKYFWDTLLDADLESDVLGWQYISGSLPDGHELDRMDNPEEEGYKYDAEGEYVRQWIPELARVPSEWIHHPWDAPPAILGAAGVELGCNYPRPIVEVEAARVRLSQAISQMWEKESALKNAVASSSKAPEERSNVNNGSSSQGRSYALSAKPSGGGVTIEGEEVSTESSYHDQTVPNMPNPKGFPQAQQTQDRISGRWQSPSLFPVRCEPPVKQAQHFKRDVVPLISMPSDLHSCAESSSARQIEDHKNTADSSQITPKGKASQGLSPISANSVVDHATNATINKNEEGGNCWGRRLKRKVSPDKATM